MTRPDTSTLLGKNTSDVPMSCQRVVGGASLGERIWIGPDDAVSLSDDDNKAYDLAHAITCHLAIRAPRAQKSGHPGGPLSAFTPCYVLARNRNPHEDQPLRMSPGHLSVLGYSLQWLFGRNGSDPRLASPQAIIDTFRTPDGLPGHIEAGIGDIPFGSGPLGKMVSHGVGAAFGLKYLQKSGKVDVLLADGDSQEGQVQEALRLATHLKLDNLVVHGDWNDIQLSGLPTETVAADFAGITHATGWHVIEVQNGNDPAQCQAALDAADKLTGRPVFICYYTTMGYGVDLMEQGSDSGQKNYHGAPLSDDEAEAALSTLPDFEEVVQAYQPYQEKQKKSYESSTATETDIGLTVNKESYTRTLMEEKGAARKEFGALHLMNLMKSDKKIIVLHADLAGSGGFDKVEKQFPERVINVGVAEANMYMMAAGMRQAGLLPVTYTFAAFATNEARANARLIDINSARTRCAVLHDATHSGLSVGEDGETHQEQNYLNIPFYHTHVWMPADSNQAAAMAERGLEIIAEGHASVYVFSPRSGHEQLTSPDGSLIYGTDYTYNEKADLLRGSDDINDDVTLIATGIAVHDAIEAADALSNAKQPIQARVLNVSSLQHVDTSAIIKAALETRHLVVIEDHNAYGGLASQVADIIADFSLPCSLRRLGLHHYFPSATAASLKLMAGLDSDSIVDAALDEVRKEVSGGEDALVTALYELKNNITTSARHGERAAEFFSLVSNKEGYLQQLRQYWKEKACSSEQLPSDDDIETRLT